MKRINRIKKILTFLLTIVIVAGTIHIPAKAASTEMTITGFYTEGTSDWFSPTLTDSGWRVYFRTSQSVPSAYYQPFMMSNGTQEQEVVFNNDGGATSFFYTFIPTTLIDGNKSQTITVKAGEYGNIKLTSDFVFYVNAYSWSTNQTNVTPNMEQKVMLNLNMNPNGNISTGGDATEFYLEANIPDGAYIDSAWAGIYTSPLTSPYDGITFHTGGVYKNGTLTNISLHKYADKLYRAVAVGAQAGDTYTVKGLFKDQNGYVVGFLPISVTFDGSKWSQVDLGVLEEYDTTLTIKGNTWASPGATRIQLKGTDAYLAGIEEIWSPESVYRLTPEANSGIYLNGNIASGATLSKYYGNSCLYMVENLTGVTDGDTVSVKGTFYANNGKTKFTIEEKKYVYDASTEGWADWTMPEYTGTLKIEGSEVPNATPRNWFAMVGTDAYVPGSTDNSMNLIAVDDGTSGIYVGTATDIGSKVAASYFKKYTSSFYQIDLGIEVADDAVVTIKGVFCSLDGNAKITFEESKFQYTGGVWVDYVEKPSEYSGTLSFAGDDYNHYAPDCMYLRGTDEYLKEDDPAGGDHWGGEERYMVSADANSGIFLNDTPTNGALIKLNGATNLYWAQSFGTATDGDTLTIKGTFITADQKVKITFEEVRILYKDGKWQDTYLALPDTGVSHDVNADGELNAQDLVRLSRHLSEEMVAVNEACVDVNFSGQTDDYDKASLRKILVGMIFYYEGEVYGKPVYSEQKVIEKMAYDCPEIGIWNADKTVFTPYSESEIDAILQKYKAAGLTLINTEKIAEHFHDTSLETEQHKPLRTYLKAAERNGLGVIVFSNIIHYMLTAEQGPEVYGEGWQTFLGNEVDKLLAYSSAFRGFVLADELTIQYAENYQKVTSFLHENYPELLLYTSQLPVTVYDQTGDNKGVGALTTNTSASKEDAYRDYVWSYAEETGHFIYDLYPLVYSEDKIFGQTYESEYGVVDDWYLNLQYVANEVKEHNYSFTTGITIQACKLRGWSNLWNSYETYAPEKDEDIGFQVYTAMAYGVNNINYFSYGDHWDEEVLEGMTNEKVYTAVSNVNAQIDQLANAYLSFSWIDTLDIKAGTTVTDTGEERLKSVEVNGARALVGRMKDADGFNGYMVANADGPRENKTLTVSLAFNNAEKALVYTNGVQEEVELTDGTCTLTIPSGQGVFVIPLRLTVPVKPLVITNQAEGITVSDTEEMKLTAQNANVDYWAVIDEITFDGKEIHIFVKNDSVVPAFCWFAWQAADKAFDENGIEISSTVIVNNINVLPANSGWIELVYSNPDKFANGAIGEFDFKFVDETSSGSNYALYVKGYYKK